MPSRKQSAIGVWITPSLTKKILAPVHSATWPLPVEHHGVGEAVAARRVLGDGADHVEAGRLARHGAVFGSGRRYSARSGGCPWPAPPARNSSAIPRWRSRDGSCSICAETPSARSRARRSAAHRRLSDCSSRSTAAWRLVDLGHLKGISKSRISADLEEPLGMLGAARKSRRHRSARPRTRSWRNAGRG